MEPLLNQAVILGAGGYIPLRQRWSGRWLPLSLVSAPTSVETTAPVYVGLMAGGICGGQSPGLRNPQTRHPATFFDSRGTCQPTNSTNRRSFESAPIWYKVGFLATAN